MNRRTALGIALVTGGMLAGSVFSGGCGGHDQQQAQVVTSVPPDSATGTTLTPRQRGVVRRDILTVAEKGIASLLSGDPKAMSPYFKKDWVDYYAKQDAAYRAQGLTRVRKHDDVTLLDVTQINEEGTEAIVEYDFTDRSYFARKDGSKTAEPINKASSLQLTLDRDPKTQNWVIVRMIGGSESLK